MSGDNQQIHSKIFDIHRHFADLTAGYDNARASDDPYSLAGIGHDQCLRLLVLDCSDKRLDRLQRAHFVVRQHDAHDRSLPAPQVTAISEAGFGYLVVD